MIKTNLRENNKRTYYVLRQDYVLSGVFPSIKLAKKGLEQIKQESMQSSGPQQGNSVGWSDWLEESYYIERVVINKHIGIDDLY